jgi:hypothetical protein
MRKSRPTPTVIRIGVLSDAMTDLAIKVVKTLVDGPRLVWADNHGNVFSSDPGNLMKIPTWYIAGTFNLGQPVQDIEDDLRELATQHMKNQMIT